jgi:hypothetical protein
MFTRTHIHPKRHYTSSITRAATLLWAPGTLSRPCNCPYLWPCTHHTHMQQATPTNPEHASRIITHPQPQLVQQLLSLLLPYPQLPGWLHLCLGWQLGLSKPKLNTAICNHFFSLTDTTASASAIFFTTQPYATSRKTSYTTSFSLPTPDQPLPVLQLVQRLPGSLCCLCCCFVTTSAWLAPTCNKPHHHHKSTNQCCIPSCLMPLHTKLSSHHCCEPCAPSDRHQLSKCTTPHHPQQRRYCCPASA